MRTAHPTAYSRFEDFAMNAITQPVKPAAERAPSYYSASLNFETDYPTLQGSVCLLYTSRCV